MATKYITLTNLGTFLGQLKDNYEATNDKFGGIKIGYGTDATNKKYPVKLDSGKAFVEVPWELGTFTLGTANNKELGGIKIGYSEKRSSDTYEAPLLLATGTADNGKAYVELSVANSNDAGLISADHYNILANWKKYELPTATTTKLGGVKIGSNITVGTDGTISLKSSNITDALGYTPADEKNTSSGGGMVDIKYSDLKSLIGNLVPGTKYRITNYQTIVNNSTDYKSAELKFDIIVEAITTNTLSENAKACKSSTTNDFNGCNLDAWELKYCIENDTNRFKWANTNGTGVIYYMKDEWGNEAPYDFKNIKIALDSSTYVTPPTNNYFFTFSKVSNVLISSPTISDASLDGTARFNIIKPSIYGGDNRYSKLLLNKIVCIYDEGKYYNQEGEKIIGNYFDYNCYNIALLGSPQYNKFGADCYDIVIGGPDSKNNIFGKNCKSIYLSKIIFGSGYIKKTQEDADQISYNKFGDNCSNIESTINFHGNIFGNNCKCFKVLTNFMNNRIYDNCIGWEFGNYCMKNIIESNNYIGEYWNVNELIEKYSPIYHNNPYNNIYAKVQIWNGADPGSGKYITADWVCDCVFGKNSHAVIKIFYDTVGDHTLTIKDLSISSMIKNLYFHDLIVNTINDDVYDDNKGNVKIPDITIAGLYSNNYLNSNDVIHATRVFENGEYKNKFCKPYYT